jgi:hypothetical protein
MLVSSPSLPRWWKYALGPMDDEAILGTIHRLVEEEHHLERTHADTGLDDTEASRLKALEVQLDQCWDLLRQRRARRNAGQDPDTAEVRPPGTVEGYRQ